MVKGLSRILDIASLLLLSSVVMDSVLWFSRQYLIPSWTMAAMSAGVIVLLQALKRQIR